MADSVVIENIINLQQLIEQKYAEVTMETTNTTTITTLESTTVEGVTEENTTVDSTTVVEKKKKKSSKKSKKSKQDSTAKQVQRIENKNKKIHVRSVDASQVQQKFNRSAGTENDNAQLCKLCQKQVFQMERIKAERVVWHKNCFTCTVCSKKLSVDNYNSHEGLLYCKPHFKQLFQPKAVLDNDEPYYYKPELIIRESQPVELPSDVVRGSENSNANWGMEELSNLDLKTRFSLFEKASTATSDDNGTREEHKPIKRSESILSRLARFDRENTNLKNQLSQSCGNFEFDDSSSEGEEGLLYDDLGNGNRLSLIGPDNSVSFGSISNIKSKWEDDKNAAPLSRKEELARQRKEEIQMIRARQCQGRQLRLKEQYENAVQETNNEGLIKISDVNVDAEKIRNIKDIFEKGMDSETTKTNEQHITVDSEKLKSLKDMFEKTNDENGVNGEKHDRTEELNVPGAITKEARNMFKKMEENGFQNTHKTKQEMYGLENKEAFKTTSTMLDLFRRLEKEPDGYLDYGDEEDEEEESDEGSSEGEESHDEDEEEDEDDLNYNQGLTPQQEELLQIARDRSQGKNLRDKFERWEFSTDEEKQLYEKQFMIPESEEIQASLNTAKNLRAHFEQLQKEPSKPAEKPRIKVNRFVWESAILLLMNYFPNESIIMFMFTLNQS